MSNSSLAEILCCACSNQFCFINLLSPVLPTQHHEVGLSKIDNEPDNEPASFVPVQSGLCICSKHVSGFFYHFGCSVQSGIICIHVLMACGRSFIKRMNINGPKMDPCGHGTPKSWCLPT